MCTGDLLGSGTISGATKDSLGSLLEITWGGKEPLTLDGGARRTFLEDGDEVVFTGRCEKDGVIVGFGECRGKVLPAPKEREW
jgi:fumarylacetoacetase